MKSYSELLLILSAALGFGIYLMFAWMEWQKLTKTKMSIRAYIMDDQAGFICAILLAVASYLALPELASIQWLRERAGFTPNKTPLGAMAASFLFSVVGYQLRAIGLDWIRDRVRAVFGVGKSES